MVDKDKLVGRIQPVATMAGRISTDNSASLTGQVSITGKNSCNYGIVESKEFLPTYYKPSENAMYYCIEEGIFFLWDNGEWTDELSELTREQMETLKSIITN